MKKVIGMMIVVIMLLAFSACQTVPDEAFVVKNDTGRMVEKAVNDLEKTKAVNDSVSTTAVSVEVTEENYAFSTTAMDGKLTITVDAPAPAIESEKVPMANVSGTGWTQEQVTGFYNYLFPGGDAVTGDNVPGVLTKSEIKELVAWYNELLDEGTAEEKTLYTNEELREEIKNLEKEYESAPETEPELDIQSTDGTLTSKITEGDRFAGDELMVLDAGTEDARMYVSIPVDANGNHTSYLGYHRNLVPDFSEANAVKVDESDWADAAQDKLQISYDEAKKLCDDFFLSGGVSDAVLSDAYVMDGKIKTYAEDPGTVSYAYQFYYVRTVQDYPAANIFMHGTRGDESKNTIPWDYENIMFWVSDNGIESISWHANTEVGEIISENTKAMDFDEATEIFETMVSTIYAESEKWNHPLSAMNVDISEIELALVRVRDQDCTSKSGIYTPAWVFYGKVSNAYDDGFVRYGRYGSANFPFGNEALLIINAIDGSIIDLEKGY